MLYSIARATGIVALLCPSVLAAALPVEHRAPTPEVSWKTRGVSHLSRRTGANGPGSRDCWDGDFNIDTDMDEHWPDTGKTVHYDFEISNVSMAPDGVEKWMQVINGQYPGPTIIANWGDTIEVTVKNSLEFNGTGIHWHGIRQLGTNQEDGVGGITECPIAPGASKTYTFKATQYGSSWYHSHYSAQYAEGLVGGIIINGPTTKNWDVDIGMLQFTDWFHMPIFTVNAAALHASGPPIADNMLVNGSMTSEAGGKYAVTNLQPGKKHLLRLVNVGINNYVHVALDGHTFTVVAADFTPIVPYEATSIVMGIGQRYDVIVEANQPVQNYWLRVGTGGGKCDGPNTNAANIRSVFHYDGANSGNPNSTGPALPTGCADETNVVPWVKTQIPQETPEEMLLGFTNTRGSGNLVQWLVNGSPMLVDLSRPTLQNVINGNDTFNTAENLFKVGEADKWQYWVIQQDNVTNKAPPLPHPIHLHGHDFYVLDFAENAQWTGDISGLKSDNPIRRDTATLPAGGYLVLAFLSDNPGAWLMHCHIPFHISAGLGVQFLERMDEIAGSYDINSFDDTCDSWRDYQAEFFPNGFTEGDSLLKRVGGDSLLK